MLVVGFALLCLSEFRTLVEFGLLIGLALTALDYRLLDAFGVPIYLVNLALLIAVYRHYRTAQVDALNELKG